MGTSWSLPRRAAAAWVALCTFVPAAVGCGAAASSAYGPPSVQRAMPETARRLESWESPGTGFSEPSDVILAQAEIAGEPGAYGPTGPEGTPPPAEGSGEQTADTDADAIPDSTDPEATWDEIALPEVSRPAERLVIKSGTLRIELDPPEEGPAKVTEIAKRFGGYVAASSETSITIRVPNESFEEVLEAIAQLGQVADRQVRGEDVTEEYYDLNVRLRNSLAVRTRYLVLLERAETVEEALLVERELERVTLEIERLRGRLRYLRDRVQDATIEVYFLEEYEAPEESSPGPIGWIFYGLYLGVKWLFLWDEPGPGR